MAINDDAEIGHRYPSDSDQGAKNIVDLVRALKEYRENISGRIEQLESSVGDIDGTIQEAVSSQLSSLQQELATVDSRIASAVSDVRDQILDGVGDDFDTLMELAQAIGDNADLIGGLQDVAKSHVRYDAAQSLTDAQKTQARGNIGAVGTADYASSTQAGLIKASDKYATFVDATGLIYAKAKTATEYGSLNDNAFLSKKTLENIKESLVKGVGDAAYLAKTGKAADAAKADAVPWSGVTSTPTSLDGYGISCVVTASVPDGYAALDCISSDSRHQYIDTGIQLLGDFFIEGEFSAQYRSIYENPVMSIWTSTYNYWNLFVTQNTTSQVSFYTGGHHYINADVSSKTKFSIRRTGNVFTFILDGKSTSWGYSRNDNPTTLKLFARGDGVDSDGVYIYSLNVNNVHKFVPCVRLSDNISGMIDVVSNTFFATSRGDDFVHGDIAHATIQSIDGFDICDSVAREEIKKVQDDVSSSYLGKTEKAESAKVADKADSVEWADVKNTPSKLSEFENDVPYVKEKLDEKTYTNVIINSTSTNGKCEYYNVGFATISPTSWASQWKVRLRIEGSILATNGNTYVSQVETTLYGYGNANNITYANFNTFTSSSFRPFNYLKILRPVDDTQLANYPFRLCFQGASQTDATAHYSRTIKVTLLEQVNCVCSLFDSISTTDYQTYYHDLLATVKAQAKSIGYWTYSSASSQTFNASDLNCVDYGLQETGDANSYDRILDTYFRPYVGTSVLYGYKLCMMGDDNRLYPIVTTTGNTFNKAVQTTPLRPESIWYYAGSAQVNAGALPSNVFYRTFPNSNCKYTFNTDIAIYQTVYLCGDFDAETGLFTLETKDRNGDASITDFYVQVPTNAALTNKATYFRTGKYYILLGGSHSSVNYLQLFVEHPMFYFDGTNLVPVIASAVRATNDKDGNEISSTYAKKSDILTGSAGPTGPRGYTFTPSVSADGTLSWSNNGGLDNPASVNIKGADGAKGDKGDAGDTGPQGPDGPTGPRGYTFTPSVSTAGILSWSNNGGLSNPANFDFGALHIESSGNGWVRYTNGLQICYGTYSQTSGSATENTFAKSFKSAPSVVANPVQSSLSGLSSLRFVTVGSVTAESFQVLTGAVSSTGTITTGSGLSGRYIAIGVWK